MAVTKYDTATFIAILERHPACCADLGGMEPLEAYRVTNKIADESYRQLRREVRQVLFRLESFRWEGVLPVDRLPRTTDIQEGGGVVLYDSVPLSR